MVLASTVVGDFDYLLVKSAFLDILWVVFIRVDSVTMSYIKRFKEISSQDVSSCGGKWASLGELMRAWFPFVDGFVLTIDAFWTDRSQREQEVYEAYDKLDAHYVAVRSSATKEDGIDDSFAGQFDTYLFVDKETLIEKIAECHASLDSDRIQAYCESKNINRSEIKVAVVIQKMVNSEVAGVAFTANPITSDMNEIIIEWWFWLGEAVVSWMITPDNYIWNKQTQSITSINIWQQQKKLILDIDKGWIKEEAVESTIQSIQKLSDTHITQLSILCENIEKHYDKPMDIERALEDNTLYILQARPITTLNQLSSINWSTWDDVWNNNSIVAQVKTKYANDKWYRQRFDACPHFMSFLGSAHITTTNKSSYPWGQDIAYVWFSNDTADRYHNLNQLENTATIITENIIENPHLIDGMVDDYLDAKKKFYDLCDNLKNKDLTKLSKDEIGELYKDIRYNYLQALIPSSLIDWFALTTDVIIANKIQNHLENIWYTWDVSEVFVTLTSPIFHSFLQEEELDFINLLISTNKNPSDEQIKSHQQKYFWIQNNYTNDNILGVEYFQKKKENLKDCDLHAKKEEIIQIPNNNKKKKYALIKSLNITSEIELLLRLTDKFNEAQDRRKKMTFRATHYFSIILQEIANRTQYSLHQLKYSSNTEIDKILNEEITTEDLDKRIERCMFLYTFDNEEVITDANLITELDQMWRWKINKVSVLNWFTACKGNVTGKVCIVQSVQDIHKVEEWDILVAVMTRPDYLPAMQKAIAFVTDEWGITCHAAIVAREMNKACVIGTKIATQTLNDGDLVEVDANIWKVTIIKKAEDILLQNFEQPRIKRWAGSYTFISCSYRGKQYYSSLKESLGVCFEQTLFTHRGWTVSFFVKREEFEKLGKTLAQWTKENKDWAIKKLTKLKENTDVIMNMMDTYEWKILTSVEYTSFLEVFDRHLGYHNFMKKTVDFLSPEILDEILPHFHDARVYSEAVYSRTESFFRSMAKAIAEKESRDANLLTCLTEQDIEKYIKNWILPDDKILEDRYKSSALFFEKWQEQIYCGDIVETIEQTIKKLLQSDDSIRWHTAYPGKVSGICRIVADPFNPWEFNKGDILVTGMTRPEYLPLVEKCGAFVTDAWGILSHAAITARELKKPCIIGTEIATKVLKDGDIIEVDANTWQIKKNNYSK